ncbi:hypothetical protein EJ05DRAFT_188328 [Pseudovirgaria hyperparasitica]|uniref:Uncharacterized protein n=1 Tax=Pseudovirgaria hyperparasitica TaxID=470096 RepID=A0A6A6WII3_9PEZI|nr:uncharacterized protein EJ05DRAFT_188328 [Pseudovirgaria hyperparasitica]KAF2761894.1 hypothetical protein EJ05DRAFT_188328 [Pseudovirgaria hyperparasitica]
MVMHGWGLFGSCGVALVLCCAVPLSLCVCCTNVSMRDVCTARDWFTPCVPCFLSWLSCRVLGFLSWFPCPVLGFLSGFSCPVLAFYPIPSYPILSHPILSWRSYPVLSCLVIPCQTPDARRQTPPRCRAV